MVSKFDPSDGGQAPAVEAELTDAPVAEAELTDEEFKAFKKINPAAAGMYSRDAIDARLVRALLKVANKHAHRHDEELNAEQRKHFRIKQDFLGVDPNYLYDAFVKVIAAREEQAAPKSASPAEVIEAIDRVTDELTMRPLRFVTIVQLHLFNRIRFLFGWRVFVTFDAMCAPRRRTIEQGGDTIELGEFQTDAEMRPPRWWVRLWGVLPVKRGA